MICCWWLTSVRCYAHTPYLWYGYVGVDELELLLVGAVPVGRLALVGSVEVGEQVAYLGEKNWVEMEIN